jgi:hypothetical protein
MSDLKISDYIKALDIMKKSPDDRVGVLGQLGVTGLGITAGVAASGSIACAFGATTLLGSSTLGSLLGGVFVTTTPVGWVVGSAVAAGAVAYCAGKAINSGGKSDAIKTMNIKELESTISKKKIESERTTIGEEKYARIIEALQLAVFNKAMTQEKSTSLLAQIENGKISCDYAFKAIQKLTLGCRKC